MDSSELTFMKNYTAANGCQTTEYITGKDRATGDIKNFFKCFS